MLKFLDIVPIVVLLYLIKCLQILTFYFPSFGVLFDTIGQVKDEALGFFLMAFITMTGFTFMAIFWFGSQDSNY